MLCKSEQTQTTDTVLSLMHSTQATSYLLLYGLTTLTILLVTVIVVSSSTKSWRHALRSVVNMPKMRTNTNDFTERSQFHRLRTHSRTHTNTHAHTNTNTNTHTHTLKKIRGMSPRGNYTNRATATGEISDSFCDYRCHVVSVTDPYGRILGFLDRSRYFFF
jgi:hypothetical protein